MNVVRSRSETKNLLPKAEEVACKVNLYQDVPNIEVSLDDFEEFALDRLKVNELPVLCCGGRLLICSRH